jgi:peptide/nickel transport system substrate-binding protein
MAPVTRRNVLLGLAAGLVAGCGTPLDAFTSRPAASPTPTGGRLRVGVLGDIPSLDPHQLSPPVPDVLFPIWDRLMTFGPHTSPQPVLAQTWQMSPDGRALTLTLRKGVQFHSGRELTTDDVHWTLMRLQTDPVVATTGFFSQVQPLSDVDLLDRYTIVLKSVEPWPGVFNLLALMSVVDSESMQGAAARQQAVGTGPFMFAEWQQGDHVRLVRNPRYWRAGVPRVDELYFQEFKEPQAMVSALEGGSIDLAVRPPLLDTVRFQQDSRFHVLLSDIGGTRYALLFNAVASPTDNLQLRQALLYAVDRQRVVDTVLHGIGTVANLPFAMGSPAYDSTRDQHYGFDLNLARALVNASGLDAPALDFNYTSVSAEWAEIGQIYQADLASIGVTLNLKPTDPVVLVSNLRARTFNGLMTGSVPLGATSPAQQAVDPYYSPLLSFSGFKSDRLVQLASDLQHEVDPARLPQVYARWCDYVLDEAWAGAVATSPPAFAMTPRVTGLELTQLEMPDYTNVAIAG